jgi:hypothetical protein
MKILAVCFLLIFCGHHYAPKHRHAPASSTETIASGVKTKVLNTRGKSCEQITRGFDSWGNQDDWVSEFPVEQQHRVLECLDKKKAK